jgi:hypothetical protein
MKLAEALMLRADYQRRITQLKGRLQMNARVQEGDAAAEDPQTLLAEIEQVAVDLERMIQRINRTNSATPLDETQTLADALAARDVMGTRQKVYADLAAAAMVRHDRFSRAEVRFVAAVSVAATQAKADEYARRRRELDARIQAANWTVDLVE